MKVNFRRKRKVLVVYEGGGREEQTLGGNTYEIYM